MNTDSRLKKAPLFICGCPKSGTTLLRSLLDGHSELLIFPIEMKFFRYTHYPTCSPDSKFAIASTPDEMLPAVLKSRFFKIFLGKESLTFAGNEKPPSYAPTNSTYFENYFSDLSKVETLRDFFLHYFEALLVSLQKKANAIEQYKIVDKTPLQEEYALLLKQWFPNAQFIHIVRNPYAHFVALRKWVILWEKNSGYPYLRRLIKWMHLSAYFAKYNQKCMGEQNYKIVRYEDLVQNTEKTLQDICSFAQIDFEDCLLKPTVFGQLWRGNSMSQKRFTGIDLSPLNRWKNDISPFEIRLLNQKIKSSFKSFNYPRQRSACKHKLYYRQTNERLLTYIRNRLFLQEKLNQG